jgi:hypothetical protein
VNLDLFWVVGTHKWASIVSYGNTGGGTPSGNSERRGAVPIYHTFKYLPQSPGQDESTTRRPSRCYVVDEGPHLSRSGVTLEEIPGPDDPIWNFSIPKDYRAPSWSFASLEGHIRFIKVSPRDVIAKCVECHIDSVGDDTYGQLKGSWLEIKVGDLNL